MPSKVSGLAQDDRALSDFTKGLDALMNRVPLADSGSTSGSDTLDGASDGGDSTDLNSLLSDIDTALTSDFAKQEEELAVQKVQKIGNSSVTSMEAETSKKRARVEIRVEDESKVEAVKAESQPRQVRKRRKRAKTAEEKRQRALERKMKNRESANRSRMKTLNELSRLRQENAEQAKLIRQLKEEMEQMRAHNNGLQKMLDMSLEVSEEDTMSLLEGDWGLVDEKLSAGYCYNETVVFGPYIISTPLESLVTCVKRRSESYVQSFCKVAGRAHLFCISKSMLYNFSAHINSNNPSLSMLFKSLAPIPE